MEAGGQAVGQRSGARPPGPGCNLLDALAQLSTAGRQALVRELCIGLRGQAHFPAAARLVCKGLCGVVDEALEELAVQVRGWKLALPLPLRRWPALRRLRIKLGRESPRTS